MSTCLCCRILGSVDPVLLLGGVRDFDEMVLSPSSPLSSYEFIGCMRNVSVDGYDLLQIPPNFTNLTSSMCQRSSGEFCQQPNPCMNGGKCVDEWFDFRCQCREGFSGRTCADGQLHFLLLSLSLSLSLCLSLSLFLSLPVSLSVCLSLSLGLTEISIE